jgi:glycosyltransferase involved in cell wall biosynthesis
VTHVGNLRVALLVSPDSFERFYRDALGLDYDDYVHRYRNDFVPIYAAGLRRRGVDVVAYVPSLARSGRERAADDFEVRFVALPALWERLRFTVTRAITPLERYAGEALLAALMLPGLRRALREDGIDVLYVQEYWTGRFDVLAHAVALPVVGGEHGGSSGVHVHLLKRRALQRAAAITVQSTAEQRRLCERYGREAELITNGVDTSFFTPGEVTGQAPRMLVVARLVDAQKRVSDVISALALLPEEWGLDVVGRGPDEEALRGHAQRLGCAHRVTFHGWVGSREDLRERYRRCGVFVLPSAWEAVTLAVLEAMACGAPPIVTPLYPFRDVIEDGRNGAFVPPESPARLAERVLSTYADRERIGGAARRTAVERYDRDTTLGRLATLLHEAAARSGRPATVPA